VGINRIITVKEGKGVVEQKEFKRSATK
jgi:hypothetical protein